MKKKYKLLSLITSFALIFIWLAIPFLSAAQEKKTITIAMSSDIYPFYFSDLKNEPSGILVDYWKLWAKKTNTNIKFEISSFGESLENVKNGKADIHIGCFFNDERNKYLDYAYPLIESETHIFYDSSIEKIDSLEDLKPYKIGLMKGDFSESFIKSRLKNPSLSLYADYFEVIKAAKEGEVKVFVADTLSSLYIMKELGVQNFSYNEKKPIYSNFLYSAVKKGNSSLADLINKGMSQLTTEEKNTINNKWIPRNTKTSTIRVAIEKNYPPLSSLDESGNPQGILVDYWKLFGAKNNTKIEFISDSWSNTLKLVELGDADIHSGLFYNYDRSKYLTFSKTIYPMESRIYFNPNYFVPKSIEDMYSEKIGAQKGSFQESYLRENFPLIKVIPFENFDAMVEAGENGLIKGFIAESLTLKSLLKNKSNPFKALDSPVFSQNLRIGISKTKPDLVEFINQGSDKITSNDLSEIEKRWVPNFEDRVYSKLSTIQLSPDEIAWLKTHPKLNVALTKDFHPFEYVDSQGNSVGLNLDFLRYISSRLNIELNIKSDNWPKLYSDLKSGKLDISPAMQKTEEREKYFEFTKPVVSIPHVVVSKRNNPIDISKKLKGLTIAVESGFYTEGYLKKTPGIKIQTYPSTLDALVAVTSGKVDAYVGNEESALYYIKNSSLANLTAIEYPHIPNFQISMGVKKDYAALVPIINKVLNSMSDQEISNIMDSYVSKLNRQSSFLTQNELNWLNSIKDIRVGIDPSWPPIEFFNESNQYSGISSDIARKLEDILNISLYPNNEGSWDDVITKMKKGELDILMAVAKTPERMKYMNFTKPYMSSPIVIATRDSTGMIENLANLPNMKIGVVKGYTTEQMLQKDYPTMKYYTFTNLDEGLEALSKGKIDGFIDSMLTINYTTKKLDLKNIKISGITDYKWELSIGVRKDWPEMVEILNKSLLLISDAEKENIMSFWINKAPNHINFSVIWKILLGVLLVSGSIISVIIFWNRKLQLEILRRMETEEALVSAKNEADIANIAKSEFLANMSHEIRTPMNAVIGMTNLLYNTSLNEKQHDYTDKIAQAAYNLLGIINDILDFSKIEAGKLSLEEVRFNLDTILENISNIIGIRAKDKNLELIIKKDKHLPVIFFGDPLRIEQILLNLANNAVKFTEEGEVSLSIKVLDKEPDSITLEFSVKDTGIGMTSEEVEKIFSPFTQSDASTTRKYGGTGLGLSISRKLVEMMNGNIFAKCEKNKGCTFIFTLKLKYDAESQELYSKGNFGPKKIRVLLVDDHKTALEVLETYMSDFDISYDSVQSGEEALNYIDNTEYDLVLLDWKLEGINGIETARLIKQKKSPSPKIILISAYGKDDILEASEILRLDGFLTKPVSESSLFNAIQDVFGNNLKNINRPSENYKIKQNFLNGKNILVVEDNILNQQLARELLENAGAYVTISNNGLDALNHISVVGSVYDIIFMDLQMPLMDGYEATRQIRQNKNFKSIPIIAMTADVMPGIQTQCIEAGMNDYISKPIDIKDVFEKIRIWLKIEDSYFETNSNSNDKDFNLPGINYKKALTRLGGNLALYEKILTQFTENYKELPEITYPERNEEILTENIRFFHTLKGISGSLGMESIQSQSELVEYILKGLSYEDFDSSYTKLKEIINSMISIINPLLVDDTPSIDSNPSLLDSSDELENLFTELSNALKRKKPAEIKSILNDISGYKMSNSTKETFDILVEYSKKYKYKEASLILENILSSEKKGDI